MNEGSKHGFFNYIIPESIKNKKNKEGQLLEDHYIAVMEYLQDQYNNFIDEYFSVLELMAEKLDPSKIVWISLGCFRYSPGFKDIIKHKYPDEKITVAEMFPGVDGKLRYLTRDRIDIFRGLSDRLKKIFPETFIYLCMEDAYVWNEVFGVHFNESEDLENALSNHLIKFSR